MEQWGNNYLTNNTTKVFHIGNCPYSQSTYNYENFSTYISNGSYISIISINIQLYGMKTQLNGS